MALKNIGLKKSSLATLSTLALLNIASCDQTRSCVRTQRVEIENVVLSDGRLPLRPGTSFKLSALLSDIPYEHNPQCYWTVEVGKDCFEGKQSFDGTCYLQDFFIKSECNASYVEFSVKAHQSSSSHDARGLVIPVEEPTKSSPFTKESDCKVDPSQISSLAKEFDCEIKTPLSGDFVESPVNVQALCKNIDKQSNLYLITKTDNNRYFPVQALPEDINSHAGTTHVNSHFFFRDLTFGADKGRTYCLGLLSADTEDAKKYVSTAFDEQARAQGYPGLPNLLGLRQVSPMVNVVRDDEKVNNAQK